METVDNTAEKREPAHVGSPTSIIVNFNPVTMPAHHATGLEIKKTAIAQRVNIKADFKLFRDKGNGRRDPIGDDESVPLHDGEKFEAVDGDDNS
jgi:hypothetical protein